MNAIARKTLALLLSASLFSSYTVPSYATESLEKITGPSVLPTGIYEDYVSTDQGGVLETDKTAQLTVSKGTQFNNNSAVSYGGALYLRGQNYIDGTSFTNNSVEDEGAAGGALGLATNKDYYLSLRELV